MATPTAVPTSPPISGTPQGTGIMAELKEIRDELKKAQATIDTQKTFIDKQTDMLTKMGTTPAAPPEGRRKQIDPKNAKELLELIVQNQEEFGKAIVDTMRNEWQGDLQKFGAVFQTRSEPEKGERVSQIAEQLVNEGKVTDWETAVEIATSRYATEQAKETADAEANEAKEKRLNAEAASMGYREQSPNSPGRLDSPEGETYEQTFMRKWDEHDMDAKLEADRNAPDPWKAPAFAGIKIDV